MVIVAGAGALSVATVMLSRSIKHLTLRVEATIRANRPESINAELREITSRLHQFQGR